MSETAQAFYREYIQACKVQPGDILDVGSDMMKFLLYFKQRHWKFDANLLIDALKEAVGEEGTIMIRTFNWDFCHDVPFDRAKTPSRVGNLGNVALKRPDFLRTRHALYSWCVWGKYQKELTEMDPEDSFGDGGVFDFLERKDATYLRMGNTLVPGTTFIHRSEQRAGLPYRYIKRFTGPYIDYDGSVREKTYSMFVRDLDYHFEFLPESTDQRLLAAGALELLDYEGIHIGRIRLKTAGDAVYQDIFDGKWTSYMNCTRISDGRKVDWRPM